MFLVRFEWIEWCYICHFIQSYNKFIEQQKQTKVSTQQKHFCKYCTPQTWLYFLFVNGTGAVYIIARCNISYNFFLYVLNELNDLYFSFYTIILHLLNNFTFYQKLTPKQTTVFTIQKHFVNIVYNTNTNVQSIWSLLLECVQKEYCCLHKTKIIVWVLNDCIKRKYKMVQFIQNSWKDCNFCHEYKFHTALVQLTDRKYRPGSDPLT